MGRKGLTREQLVEAAAQVADEMGLEKLTLAVVADRLGIRSPSLYNHVDGLPGLRRELALLAARSLGDLMEQAMRGKSGREALLACGEAFRKLARTRPGLYASLVQAPDPSDSEMIAVSTRVLAPLYAILQELGCRGDDAVHAIRALRGAVHGFALLESAGGFGLPVGVDDSFRWMVLRLVP